MKGAVKKIKFKTYKEKEESTSKLLEAYNLKLKNIKVKDHIETIRSFYQMGHILNIRTYLNSFFPDVSIVL